MPDLLDQLQHALRGRYTIERELGRGGMATAYLAQDVRHGRRVAIKVLHPELAAVIGADRFLVEITTTANLQHPHILGLIDSGEVGGIPYYVMPLRRVFSLTAGQSNPGRAMTTRTRSATPAFILAGISLVLAVVTGVAWLGQPLRLVNLLTIIGLGMTAGVSWTQAVWRARQASPSDPQ
jgi:hypothetical protein